MSYAKVTIVGNIGQEPEKRFTPGGQAVTNFSLAANRQYTNSSGEKIKETTWFRVSCWGKLADIASDWLSMGDQVLVVGRLKPDTNGGPRVFQKQDGSFSATFELDVEDLTFLNIKGNKKTEPEEETFVPF